jgi:hypothetical protein
MTEDPAPIELRFFPDPHTDQLVGLIFTLAMEVSTLSARQRALEATLKEPLLFDPMDPAIVADRDALLDRLMANLRQSGTQAQPLAGVQLSKQRQAAKPGR